ncbi:Protein kinase-like domain [Pseudocohnilembus persalinus]|uniref:Protein kinase-like domain n=1 Tax=Pseudocohnilembus persalinus TaxID=266149 RepID=A0A0V0R7F5_PSEPJ|nr:Protein kinase-like domain [Pseudocohnilembus persalinus]|eukprot:KRX10431.1 Protein kinase-like domain [Pseudocohnilembus persalinus]
MTFQYFHGDDLLKIFQAQSLGEMAVATLTYHVIKGVKQLHSQGAFHGNIKLENIIFSSTKKDNEIFLINLKYLEQSTESYRDRLIRKGNNFYCAPEILEGKEIGQAIDMFSVGCCVFFMIFGVFPYKNISNQFDKWTYELDLSILEKLKQDKKNDYRSNSNLSLSGIDFLFKALDPDPVKRISSRQALSHHWFINFTSKSQDSQKLQRYMELNGIASLRTILECSEMSEREMDMQTRIGTQYKKTKIQTIQEDTDIDFEDGDNIGTLSDENLHVQDFMKQLHDFKSHKQYYSTLKVKNIGLQNMKQINNENQNNKSNMLSPNQQDQQQQQQTGLNDQAYSQLSLTNFNEDNNENQDEDGDKNDTKQNSKNENEESFDLDILRRTYHNIQQTIIHQKQSDIDEDQNILEEQENEETDINLQEQK